MDMKLLFYNEDQDNLRVFDCEYECWEDMKNVFAGPRFKERTTSLTFIMSWGWSLVGEL